MSEKRMIGSCCRNASSPRKNGEELVSETISQFCATICIQVPMLEVQAPIHCTRKSRYVKATSVRRIVRAATGGAGSAASAVVAAADAWVGSDKRGLKAKSYGLRAQGLRV